MIYTVTIAIIDWALRAIALFVVPPRRSPSSGTAWLMLIFLFPIPGWLLFALMGHYKLPKARRDIQERINQYVDESTELLHASDTARSNALKPQIPKRYQSTADLTLAYGRLPSLGGNTLTMQPDYNNALADIVRDINRAKETVYVEYYAATLDLATQDLFDALARARQRGVDVRVLFDTWGSRKYNGYKPMIDFLEKSNIAYYGMLPLRLPGGHGYVRPDLRNHRKIVVIDSTIGYTGSQNLIDRTYHRKDTIVYDELVVRVSGPVVLEMVALFMTDWVSEGGEIPAQLSNGSQSATAGESVTMQILPSGPGFKSENNLRVFTDLIYRAQKSITIVNPYLVPPESLLNAITSAAERGVHIKIINSQAIDQWMVGYAQRSFYTPLLEAGVEIYLYDLPYLLHSKFMVVDDEVALVGSSNMDMRSFELDSELSLICYDAGVAQKMSNMAHKYEQKSHKLLLKEWRQRSSWRKMLENIARLTSAVQ